MSPDIELAEAFRSFFTPQRAERLAGLASTPTSRARARLHRELAHSIGPCDLRVGCGTAVPASMDGRQEVLRRAAILGLPDRCLLLCEKPELDGERIPFTRAFDRLNGSGFGFLAVLDPARLAFFQGEGRFSSLVLHAAAR